MNGHRYILVLVDYFSRFVLAFSLAEASAYSVTVTFLYQVAPILGWPEYTYSDNGPHFKNEVARLFFASRGTHMVFGPVAHHQSVGLIERTVRLVKQGLMKWSTERKQSNRELWREALPDVIRNMSNRWIASLGVTPAKVLLGYTPTHRNPVDVRDVSWNEVAADDPHASGRQFEVVSSYIMRRDEVRIKHLEETKVRV